MSVSKFDPSLGTLTSISWSLSGDVGGSARAESLDASPATLTLDLKATITLDKPGGGTLAQVIPIVSNAFSATAFDGTIDFGGTSGVSYLGLSGSANDIGTIPGVDWGDWVGLGNVTLSTNAAGQSSGSGAGNMIQSFATSAGASFEVTYTYDPVPEPSSALLSLAAVAGLGLIRRRK